jgi:hypothetical protein
VSQTCCELRMLGPPPLSRCAYTHTLTAMMYVQVFLVFAASVVGFISVLVGRWLQLDYSAKLYVMTFVLVVMAAEHSSGVSLPVTRWHSSAVYRSSLESLYSGMCPMTSTEGLGCRLMATA